MEDFEESTTDGGDSKMNFESLVNSVVMYIASMDENQFPIKRSDIVKNAMPAKSGRKFLSVIHEVAPLLEKTFGLILIDLDGTEKVYVTTSKFQRPAMTNLLKFSPERRSKRVLLLIVLSYVYMLDNSVNEEKLWRYLIHLKLDAKTVNYSHPHFGNVRRLCSTDFVRQMYLKVEKIPGSDPPENIFAWGPRAHVEFNKLEILKFVALMQSNIDPERFTTHWSKLQKEGLVAAAEKAPEQESPPSQAEVPSGRRRRRK